MDKNFNNKIEFLENYIASALRPDESMHYRLYKRQCLDSCLKMESESNSNLNYTL